MKIGEQIQRRREAQGWTAKDLGGRLQMTETEIRDWESGRSWPARSRIAEVERLLGFAIDWTEKAACEDRRASAEMC